MNKKVYLIIITIVTVLCIIGGSLYHIAGFLSDRLFTFSLKSDDIEISEKEDFFDINNINIDMDAMEVCFEKGDTLSYSYNGPENLVPTIDVSGDTLTLKNHGKIKFKNGISFEDTSLVIYMPKGMSFNNVNINLDLGNIQIKNLNCNNLDVEADAGNIEIYESEFKKFDCEAALGNVEIYESLLGYSSISCDVGNVICKNTDIDSLDISNDLGNTEVHLIGKESDYRFKLSVDLGSLNFNDKKYNDNYNSEAAGGKPVSIENDMGNITVMCGK